jgi:hypothetical protein
MRPNTTKLLQESEKLLSELRQNHKKIPWCNVPRLIREVKKTQRHLKSKTFQQKQIAKARELIELMRRAGGGWQALRGHTPPPDWLKSGASRQQGKEYQIIFAEFFQQMELDTEFQKFLAVGLGKPWQYYKNLYSYYCSLSRQEDQTREKKQKALKKLWYFVKVMRTILNT